MLKRHEHQKRPNGIWRLTSIASNSILCVELVGHIAMISPCHALSPLSKIDIHGLGATYLADGRLHET
jgi:hypothetical protein